MNKFIILLIVTFTGLFAGAQTAKEQIELGIAKFKNGDIIESYQLLAPLSKSKYFNADAEYCMGNFYRGGVGNPNPNIHWRLLAWNTELAMKWYKQSASDGNADAMADIGAMYKSSADGDKKKNEKEALKWFKKSVDKGSALGQVCMGDLYETGRLVPQDYAEAFKLYQLSANQGNSMGIYSLANAYQEGRGTAKALKEAARFYFSLLYKNSGYETYSTGRSIFLLNQLLQTAGNEDLLDPKKQIDLAVKDCIIQKYKEGFYLLTKNSSSSFMTDTAFNWLGVIYDGDHEIPANTNEAYKYFNKAAVMGYAVAQFNVGIYFANGKGIAKNETEAFKWFLKSARQEYAGAQRVIGQYYQDGTGIKKNEAEGAEWLRKSADHGDFVAQYFLGLAYRDGRGVEKDHAQSQLWIEHSAAQGYYLADDICDVCNARRTAAAAAQNNNAPVYSNTDDYKPYQKSLCSCCNGTGEKVIWASQSYVETDKYGHTHNASNYIHVKCSCCNGSGIR